MMVLTILTGGVRGAIIGFNFNNRRRDEVGDPLRVIRRIKYGQDKSGQVRLELRWEPGNS